jgi:hypothetical protein
MIFQSQDQQAREAVMTWVNSTSHLMSFTAKENTEMNL